MVDFPTEHMDVDKLKGVLPSFCTDIELFARGKRGAIFRAQAMISGEQKLVAIKVPLLSSDAMSTTLLEGKYLEKVNALGIGPKVYEFNEDYVIMEFIDGTTLGNWLEEKPSKEDKEIVLQNILIQLEILDQAGLNKYELTNPYKHIIVKKNLDIVLIDFERMRFSPKPKNVSQFKEYVKNYF
jgi:putative serine/threonine protein kinase